MADNPLVTIVLQTYNRRKMLEDALESAINQTYKNIEILIGDNCSEDDTEQYCVDMTKNDSRIKYFRHKENIGMVGNANFLLDRISGEYFIFLNDDDWLDLDYVEKSIEFIKDKPEYSMVCPSTMLYSKRFEKSGNERGRKCKTARLNGDTVLDRLKEYIKHQDSLEMSSGCFRTSILREIKEAEGQYIVDRYNEDIVLIMKFLVKGKCKMLSKTHMNKRDGGYSRDLTTFHMVYKEIDVTEKTLTKKRCIIFSEAISNDKYFTNVLGEEGAKKLARQIYLSLESFYCVGRFSIKKIIINIFSTLKLICRYNMYR